MDTVTAPTNRLAELNDSGSRADQTLTELQRNHSPEQIERFVEARLGALLRVCEAEFHVAAHGGSSMQLKFGLGEPSLPARQSIMTSIGTVLKDMLTLSRTNEPAPDQVRKQTLKLAMHEIDSSGAHSSPFSGGFAASLAHKLRNYLAAIISASEQLEDTLASDYNRESRDLAGMISRAAQSQRIVIDRFLEAFGPLTVRNERVNLHRCIGAALDNVRSAHGVEIGYQTEGENICGISDRTLLTRIVTELALNAAEANSKAAATLRWHVSRNRLVIMLTNDGAVSADEIFGDFLQPFYSKKAGHSGLGLNIVQRATEALGGTLRPITLHEHTLFAVSIPIQLEDLTDLHTERNP